MTHKLVGQSIKGWEYLQNFLILLINKDIKNIKEDPLQLLCFKIFIPQHIKFYASFLT